MEINMGRCYIGANWEQIFKARAPSGHASAKWTGTRTASH